MIEVPSAVYQADLLARRVDFLSIGTNDLTQYLLAVDRNNAAVADLYDSLHPAMVRAVLQVTAAAQEVGTPVGVCGELAGDPLGAILLVAMGVDSLSMSSGSLSRVKKTICGFSRVEANGLLEEALKQEDPESIRELLRTAMEEKGLGGLVRAGI
jgi:phosphotransferase system enzyme I (PtsP)